MNKDRKTIALALSGGGIRGAIHIGVLQAFDEHNIKIDAIAGTSAGAIVGALYSAGIAPLEIKEIIKEHNFRNSFHFSLNLDGLSTMKYLRRLLEVNIKESSYENLKNKLFVCCSNIDKGDFEIFSEGDLFSHVCASASIPIIFEPVLINGLHYLDGGLFNNLPIEPLVGNYDNLIGIHVNNYLLPEKYNIKRIANQIFSMVIKQNVKPNMKKCDFLINPILENPHRTFNKKNTEILYDIGYQEGLNFLENNNLC